MNWDYPRVPARARIADNGEGCSRFFALSFGFGGQAVDDAILNDQRMFTAMQDHYPTESFLPAYDAAYESLPGLAFWTPFYYADAQGIRTAIGAFSRPLRHLYASVHHLFADVSGDVVIVEVIDERVVLTDIEGDYIVMTNFAIDQLREVEPLQARGYGQDRYLTAQKMIDENFETFDVDIAFEVLMATTQSQYTYYPTQFSIVHDPQRLTSYFIIAQNYDHIWQMTLGDGMLRTYKGFSTPLEMSLSG